MTLLIKLFEQFGQSPWLDNLKRDWIHSGELQGWIDKGVRGLTSNPSIFEKAISDSVAYDEQFLSLINDGRTIEEAYWQLVQTDISEALQLLKPIHDSSNGIDGYVSVEVDPRLARDTAATMNAARYLDDQLDSKNLYIKIPGTKEGIPAIQEMVSEGRSINVTLLFSIERYEEVIEAYMSGLEKREGDLSDISSVASFFISRTETEVDSRLDEIGTSEAIGLKGKTAVAQGQLAYKLFLEQISTDRWKTLETRGANLQRPLWASTSTKNAAYPDTLYVDQLIGPKTVNTLPDGTLAAFLDHGTLERTIDTSFGQATEVLESVEALGIDLQDVAAQLEIEGVAAFENSFENLLETLRQKAQLLRH
ncbi:MAG: transaldolase [Acidimicrobiales bacterium]|jgi:transaldolase|nr:transaldolase [Acidimicrobiales bacterium]MDP6299391.1 transaldolase [Acidimicrobiales bacterium]HJM97092.1 transaldolase [Acidimicrobiales bacterium]